MSRNRYNSGSNKRRGSTQGQFQSTYPQRSSYEDYLAAECLIRAFLHQGGMEDPILTVLFIGGSKPKQGETDYELALKRLKSRWLERKERSYGMRELLRMKMMEKGIRLDKNPKWARSSIMKAPLIISPKIWISKQGDEKNFQIIFKWIFQNNQILSETTVSIQKNGYLNTVAGMKANMIVHRWDSFLDKDPLVCGEFDSKRIYHFLMDDLDVLHHVILHKSQIDKMELYYQDDWSEYICSARGRRRLLQKGVRKQEKLEKIKSRTQSSEKYSELFKALEQHMKDDKANEVPKIEEPMSDAESVRSQQMFRKLKIDPQGGIVVKQKSVVEKEVIEIGGVESVFNRLSQSLGEKGKALDLVPGNVFPKGLRGCVEEFGCNNYLKLYIKQNQDFIERSKLPSEKQYMEKREMMFKQIKENFIQKQKLIEIDGNLGTLEDLIKGLPSANDFLYIGSDILVFLRNITFLTQWWQKGSPTQSETILEED